MTFNENMSHVRGPYTYSSSIAKILSILLYLSPKPIRLSITSILFKYWFQIETPLKNRAPNSNVSCRGIFLRKSFPGLKMKYRGISRSAVL